MPDLTQIILVGGGLALGAVVAQLGGPTCWSWEGRVGDLRRRLSCLPRSAPPVARRAAGMAMLAVLLAGGALTAYAAQPARSPHPHWRHHPVVNFDSSQTFIPPRSAAFTTGAAEAGEGSPATALKAVGEAIPDQQALLDREIASGRWNGRPAWGLDQSQTERLVLYDLVGEAILADWYARNWRPDQKAADLPGRPTDPEIYGQALGDFQDLSLRRTAWRVANFQAEMAAAPLSGPSSVYVAAGELPREVLSAAGADPRGSWQLSAADAAGGRTLSRVSTLSPNPGVVSSAMPLANRAGT